MDNYSRLTGLICEKNTDLIITSCNKTCLEYADVNDYDQIIGKSDYELIWSDNAHIYRQHDLDALSGNHYSTILLQRLIAGEDKGDSDLLFMHTKLQKTDSTGKVTGITIRAVEIINQQPATLISLLSSKSPTEHNVFYLGKKNNTKTKLSKRQNEILFYLSLGKSNKVIANLLGLSIRTIEYYIDIIKNKYQCRSRWELVDMAIAQGFANHIPADEPVTGLIEKINAK